MTEIRLFHYDDDSAEEIAGSTVELERQIQHLVERHMESFFGVRFVASEHSTGPIHGGRIDSLGLAYDGSPVIFEYKRGTNENVVNQALYYRSWLLDHRGDFHMLVLQGLGAEVASTISWSSSRLICIAGDFTKFDEHAVQQHSQPIELVRYRLYGDDLVLFESLTGAIRPQSPKKTGSAASGAEHRGINTGKPITKTQDAITRFWTDHLELSKDRVASHRSTQPGFRQYLVATTGVLGLSWAYAVYQQSTRVELYINRSDPVENTRVFEFLRRQEAEIEQTFGGPLNWEALEDSSPCRISSRLHHGGYLSDESRWPEAHEATIDAMVRLQSALQPHIEEVDS